MLNLTLIAFIGGFLTIAAPCILAVLPIILGSTIGQTNKLRPLAIVAGLTVSFTGFGIIFAKITDLFGLSNNTLRIIALVILALFGLALIFPEIFEKMLSSIQYQWHGLFPKKNRAASNASSPQKKKGLLNAFLVGASLGLVWVPCAGPILGIILTLAATQSDLWKVTTLMLAYSLGAGLPMLIIAYGGNFVIQKLKFLKQRGQLIQKIAGGVLLVGILLIATGFDVKISAALGNLFPNLNHFEQSIVDSAQSKGASTAQNPETSTSIDISSLPEGKLLDPKVPAPELIGTQAWINSSPLQINQLKGKVVIVDFWTYSCINCIRTLPYLNAWHEAYQKNGLVIIGVHTPEFAFEKELPNVQKAVNDFGIHYPVVQDNGRTTWNAYQNNYWPAKYIIDRNGFIRYIHFGEGEYEETEKIIRGLLAESQAGAAPSSLSNAPSLSSMADVKADSTDFSGIRTAETYLGYERSEFQGNFEPTLPDEVEIFSAPPLSKLGPNLYYLVGNWLNVADGRIAKQADAKIIINYQANKINLVAEGADGGKTPVKATLKLDGKPLPKKFYGKAVGTDGKVHIQDSTLYNLVDTGNSYERHTLEIDFEQPEVKAYVFTFG